MLSLEELESRLLCSTDLVLFAGQTLTLSQPTTVPGITEAAGAAIVLLPGASLTAQGGTSQINGTITFEDPSCFLELDSGSATIDDATIGGNDPTPGSVYVHGGASVAVVDSFFSANFDNGAVPGLSTIDSLTTSTAFSGTNTFWGYSQLYNFSLMTLAGGSLSAPSVVAEAGTLTVTGQQSVSGTVYTGDRSDASLAVQTGASLTAANVYLAAPESLVGTVSGPTTTLTPGPLPVSTFADAVVVAALTRKDA